jgi:hypothetical protein
MGGGRDTNVSKGLSVPWDVKDRKTRRRNRLLEPDVSIYNPVDVLER